MRCSHPNLRMTEVGEAHTVHLWENGKLVLQESDFGNYTGELHVSCPDCQLKRRFTKGQQRPAWLEKRWHEAAFFEG